MATVLVVKLGALGDLLLADGALRDIRAHHPRDRIVLLTRRPFAALMARCPHVDAVLADDNAPRWRIDRMAALARTLRSHGFDHAYDLQNSRRSGFYRRRLLPGARWSAGECVSGKGAEATPALERHANQLAAAGIDAAHARAPRPLWLAESLPAALAARLHPPYAVLLPGASARHPRKRWPGFADLARLLAADGLQVTSVPGPDEMQALAAMPGDVLLDGDRPLTIPQLATVLLGAAVVVGNDSGPTHLAAHLGCRGLARFVGRGPTPAQVGIVRPPRFDALVETPLANLDAPAVHAALPANTA
jgi:ADP-heptose:LPS heptosyltransferase